MSHQLTVTQLAFSPNDQYLLSVSRDRRWSLFSKTNATYELVVSSSKTNGLHSRIIWCCSWTPDSKYFATASRDGKVGIWSLEMTVSKTVAVVASLEMKNSVTAMDFAPKMDQEGKYVLALGFENGTIHVYKLDLKSADPESTWVKILDLNSSMAHHLTVKRLRFRPCNEPKNTLQLASCGSDCTVKIHELSV